MRADPTVIVTGVGLFLISTITCFTSTRRPLHGAPEQETLIGMAPCEMTLFVESIDTIGRGVFGTTAGLASATLTIC